MVQVALPAVTDGVTPTTGTPFDKAFRDGCAAAIDDVCHSATNPGEAVKDIIDETVNARGNLASVGARIGSVVDPNGNPLGLVLPASLRNGFVQGNLLRNGEFLDWSRGNSAAPDHFVLGGGGSVERCGAGLTDVNQLSGFGATYDRSWAARVRYAASPTDLSQHVVPASLVSDLGQGILARYPPVKIPLSTVPGYDDEADRHLPAYMIGHVMSVTAGASRLRLAKGGTPYDSPFHPGDGLWYTLLAGPVTGGGYTSLIAQCRQESAGDGYFQALSVFALPIGLKPMYIPGLWRFGSWTFPTIATPTVATGYGYFAPTRPAHLVGLSAYAAGAVPTGGTTLKLDVMVPIGGTFVSCFQTLLAFTASDRHAYALFDPSTANYRRLTVRPQLAAATAIADNSVARLDVNARDSGNTGANIVVTLHYLQQLLPFDNFRALPDMSEA